MASYGSLRLLHPADLSEPLAAIQFDRSGTTHIGRFCHQPQLYSAGVDWCERIVVFGRIFAAMYGLYNGVCVPPVTTRHAIFE
ncbi:hypothetical protein ACNKHV_25725 [Shigella flexneri]